MSSILQPSHCYICDYPVIAQSDDLISTSVNIFDPNAKVRSGKQLCFAVSEIIEQTVTKQEEKISLLCKKCHKFCLEYDGLQTRMESIKKDLISQYSKRKKANVKLSPVKVTRSPSSKRVVLPASKLRPLPPQYVIINRDAKSGKLSMPQGKPQTPTFLFKLDEDSSILKKTDNIVSKSMGTDNMKQKITIDNSLLLSPPKNKEINLVEEIDELKTDVTKSEVRSMPIITVAPNSLLNFDINNLPKNFLEAGAMKVANVDDKDDDLNNDDQPMEIDEDCSYTISQTPNSKNFNATFVEHLKKSYQEVPLESKQTMFDINILQELNSSHISEDSQNQQEIDLEEADQKFVLGKVEILNEDDEIIGDENTIVMSGEDGSVMRMVSGQQLLYGDQEISLIIPRDENENESQDSNEDSQIELQVSGDEETANAIIAATKEQGGAFIKIQSGAMYRVQSVQSKIEQNWTATAVPQMVSRSGSLYKCLLCGTSDNWKEDEEGNPESPKKSKIKNFSTTQGAEMCQHMKQTHNAKIYICNRCGEVIRKRIDYYKHIAQHTEKSKETGQKKHECSICKKKCSSKNLLQEHMNVHSGTKPYSCGICQKNFASKYTFQAHMKTHQDRPRPFECKECKKTFFTQQNLTQHEKTHDGSKDFICNICGKAFGTQHNLEVHGVVHSGVKGFVCGVCGKGFARKAEIRDHIRIHTGERPFACELCGALFAQRSNLQSHVRATHMHDKRHACDQCDKRFKRRRLLDYHIKACHTGERPFQCEVCKATFVYPEHYKKHARIHSGEKPYVCEVCGKSFNTRDNRNAHRYVHSDKKPYECLVCAAGFMRKPLLLQHMNSSGHLTESIVVNQPRVTQEEPTIRFQTMDGTPIELNDTKTDEGSSEDNVAKVYISTDGEKKIILQDGKSLNLVLAEEGVDGITLEQNVVESSEKVDASLFESIENGSQIVANDENGDMVRLVQIQLPNGNTGWIAIN